GAERDGDAPARAGGRAGRREALRLLLGDERPPPLAHAFLSGQGARGGGGGGVVARHHGVPPVDHLHARRPVADAARPLLAAAGGAGLGGRQGAGPADLGGWRGRGPQPIWAEDVAAAVMNALASSSSTYELAGPEVLSYNDIVRAVLRAERRRRRLVHVPLPIVRASLRVLPIATWEEVELLEEPMVTER